MGYPARNRAKWKKIKGQVENMKAYRFLRNPKEGVGGIFTNGELTAGKILNPSKKEIKRQQRRANS